MTISPKPRRLAVEPPAEITEAAREGLAFITEGETLGINEAYAGMPVSSPSTTPPTSPAARLSAAAMAEADRVRQRAATYEEMLTRLEITPERARYFLDTNWSSKRVGETRRVAPGVTLFIQQPTAAARLSLAQVLNERTPLSNQRWMIDMIAYYLREVQWADGRVLTIPDPNTEFDRISDAAVFEKRAKARRIIYDAFTPEALDRINQEIQTFAGEIHAVLTTQGADEFFSRAQ
jgi:hypothetical protein